MDKELIRYIIVHFPRLLTADEKMASRHIMSLLKLGDDDPENSSRAKLYRRRGLLTDDPAVLELLKDGNDMFEQRTCERIMAECPEKVFLNNCPQCNRLARTPYARQCRYCGYNWHDVVAAKFMLHSSFSITGRVFFLMDTITGGQVEKGQFLDLTMLGLVSKPKINSIEHVLKNAGGAPTAYIALGTNELNEEEMNYLMKQGGFGAPLDVLKER
jgi:hypothetical protein